MKTPSTFKLTVVAGFAVALLAAGCSDDSPAPQGELGTGGNGSAVDDDAGSGPVTSSSSVAGVGGGAVGSGPSGSGGGAPECKELDGAPQLDAIDDCDDSGFALDSTLADGDDADWYEFDGLDTAGCAVNPTIEIDSPVMSELCAFFSCHEGDTALKCNGDSVDTTYAVGNETHVGCCTLGDKLSNFQFNCKGQVSDSAHVWVRVTSDQAECSDYTLTAHY